MSAHKSVPSIQIVTARRERARIDKMNKLRTILETHGFWERRTMADLRTAGYDFQSIDRARRYLKAQDTIANLSPGELLEFVDQLQESQSRKVTR